MMPGARDSLLSLRTLALVLLPCTLLACQPAEPTQRAPAPFDPQLFRLDAMAPHTRFDGRGGSILPGEGWRSPDAWTEADGPRATSWALEGRAHFHAPRPLGSGPWDFWAELTPFDYSNAPPQQMELVAGERVLARAVLEAGWQVLRLPLPADAFDRELVDFELRFSRATRPADVSDNPDHGKLSAAFRTLAFVPRASQAPEALLESFAPETRDGQLSLGAFGALSFPVPTPSRVQLRLAQLASRCAACSLRIDATTRGAAPETLWQSDPLHTGPLELSLPLAERGATQLHLRMGTPGVAPESQRGEMQLRLAPNWIEVQPEIQEGSAEMPQRPHIFLYLIDTLRADALESYGSQRPSSPHISAFAAEAVVYERAWTPAPWTLPAVASLLTGLYPSAHGALRGKVDDSVVWPATLPERLQAAGYQTVAISQSRIASAHFGLAGGFEHFFFSDQLNGWHLRSQEMRARLAAWLSALRDPTRPIFAYLHSVDPHVPYSAPAPAPDAPASFASQQPGRGNAQQYLPHNFAAAFGDDPIERAHLRARYDDEVRHADREFGQFVAMLRQLNLYNDALIVLLSDHGEEFGEHGGYDHGRTLYEELLHIPLVIKYPHGRWAGQRRAERVSLVDVLPTVLELAGAPVNAKERAGVSLLRRRSAPFPGVGSPRSSAEKGRAVMAETQLEANSSQRGVDLWARASGDHKCIWNGLGHDRSGEPAPPWLRFDLSRDAAEHSPDTESDSACRQSHAQWRSRRQVPDTGAGGEVDTPSREALRALGYIE